MYCPNCSTQSLEGAKFCKACGMNLGMITNALNGGVTASDPLRDREYKRARKQIGDGIHGTAIGAALVVGGFLTYFLGQSNSYVLILAMALALAGVIKLFRSIGVIIDAKMGAKLVDPTLQHRGSGGLVAQPAPPTPPPNSRPSQRLPAAPVEQTPQLAVPSEMIGRTTGGLIAPPPGEVEAAPEPPGRIGTSRVNREHSTPLKRIDTDDEIFSRLRN
jgi:hypothetical protein